MVDHVHQWLRSKILCNHDLGWLDMYLYSSSYKYSLYKSRFQPLEALRLQKHSRWLGSSSSLLLMHLWRPRCIRYLITQCRVTELVGRSRRLHSLFAINGSNFSSESHCSSQQRINFKHSLQQRINLDPAHIQCWLFRFHQSSNPFKLCDHFLRSGQCARLWKFLEQFKLTKSCHRISLSLAYQR